MNYSFCKKTTLDHYFSPFNGISWIFEDVTGISSGDPMRPFNALMNRPQNKNLACCRYIQNIVHEAIAFEQNPEFNLFFLPTPYESYHLTYLDGVNESYKIGHPWRDKEINQTFFNNYDIDILSHPFSEISPAILKAYLDYVESYAGEHYNLIFKANYDLELKPIQSVNWKNDGVFIEFDGASKEDKQGVIELQDFKNRFGEITKNDFGFRSNSNIPLHMTLGYFSFPNKAERVFEHLSKLSPLLAECPSYHLTTARHCPFSTMAHYFI